MKKEMVVNMECIHCGIHAKDDKHALFECKFAQGI